MDSCIINVSGFITGRYSMTHQETSLQTKKMLCTSLKKIMKHKAFSKITVSELIKDCNVNRKTFYYHFEDIPGLFRWILKQDEKQMLEAGLQKTAYYSTHSPADIRLFLRYHSYAILGFLQNWSTDDTEHIDEIIHQICLLIKTEIEKK